MVIRKKSRSHLKPVRRRDRNGHMRTVYIKKSSSKKTRFGNIRIKDDCMIDEGRRSGRIYGYFGQCIEKMVDGKLQDIKHGLGTLGVRVGDDTIVLYSGHWKNGKKHGKGTDYYSDGQIWYEGNFEHGKWHGKGTLYNEDGTIRWKGRFENEKRVLPKSPN